MITQNAMSIYFIISEKFTDQANEANDIQEVMLLANR